MNGEYRASFSLQGVPVTNNYVSRPADTAEIERILLSEKRFHEQMVFVLFGLGGIGKTQLAVDFARHRHTQFTSVFWLDGRTEESLKRSIVGCATRVSNHPVAERSRKYLSSGEGSMDSIVLEVLDWLSQPANTSWLLVFDNVDREYRRGGQDPNAYDIHTFFPGDHGSILITTRQAQLAQLGASKKLDKVDESQAREIFQKWCGDSSGRSYMPTDNICTTTKQIWARANWPGTEIARCQDILSKLDGLPLALAQSAAYLRETGIDCVSYLQCYEKQWNMLMKSHDSPLLSYAERNIATTWSISWEVIKSKNEAAASLLLLWAFLDNNALSHQLFQAVLSSDALFPEWLCTLATDELKFTEATRVLLNHSMIERATESNCYSVHPVVHTWASNVQVDDKEQLELIRTAAIIVGLGIPKTKNQDYWTVSRALLPHADICSQRLLSERDRFLALGETKVAANGSFDAAIDAAHLLGDLYRNHGKLKLAEELYNLALKGKQQSMGPNHISTLDTMNNLGVLHRSLGNLEEAEKVCLVALRGREESLGRDHISTLGTVNNLALVFMDKGQLQKAEEMYARALKGREAILGPDHLSTIRIKANMGLLFAKKNDPKRAEENFQSALQDYEKVLGPDHTLTLHVVNNLGLLFADNNRLEEAEAMYARALKGQEQQLGRNHIWTIDTSSNLALLFAVQKKRKEAEEKFKFVLESKEKILGPAHISTVTTVSDLGCFYADEGRQEEAIDLLSRALEGHKTAFGPEDPRSRSLIERLRTLRTENDEIPQQPLSRLNPIKNPSRVGGCGFYMQYLECKSRRQRTPFLHGIITVQNYHT